MAGIILFLLIQAFPAYCAYQLISPKAKDGWLGRGLDWIGVHYIAALVLALIQIPLFLFPRGYEVLVVIDYFSWFIFIPINMGGLTAWMLSNHLAPDDSSGLIFLIAPAQTFIVSFAIGTFTGCSGGGVYRRWKRFLAVVGVVLIIANALLVLAGPGHFFPFIE